MGGSWLALSPTISLAHTGGNRTILKERVGIAGEGGQRMPRRDHRAACSWMAQRTESLARKHESFTYGTGLTKLANVYKMNVTGLRNTYVLLASMRQSHRSRPCTLY